MFDTAPASNDVKLALLEGQTAHPGNDRATYIERAANLGLPAPAVGDAAKVFERAPLYQLEGWNIGR